MNAIIKGYQDVPMTRRRAQLLAEYADKLAEMLENAPDDQDLAEWVQSKIDRAAGAIQSAYHYLDQEDDEDRDDLEKARTKKYDYRRPSKRVNKRTGRREWDYFYTSKHGAKVSQGAFVEGAAFRLTWKGRRGHFHIERVEGDQVFITHDSRPDMEPVSISKGELRALLQKQHAKAEQEHLDKKRRDVERIKKRNVKQGLGLALHRLRQAAQVAGVELDERYQRKPKKKRKPAQRTQATETPREDRFDTMPEVEESETSFQGAYERFLDARAELPKPRKGQRDTRGVDALRALSDQELKALNEGYKAEEEKLEQLKAKRRPLFDAYSKADLDLGAEIEEKTRAYHKLRPSERELKRQTRAEIGELNRKREESNRAWRELSAQQKQEIADQTHMLINPSSGFGISGYSIEREIGRRLEERAQAIIEEASKPTPRDELTETAQQIIEEANQEHEERHDEHQEITKFELGEHTHTKTGAKLFTAKQTERVDRDEYFRRVEIAKKHRGRYERRYVRGFVFKNAEDARAFALEVEGAAQEAPETSAETVTPHEDHPSADNFETMPEVETPKSSAREQELFNIVYDKTLDRKQAVKKRHRRAYLDLIEKRPIGAEERRALIELGREYTGILQQLIDAVEIPGVSKGDTYAKLDAYAEIKGIAYTDRQNSNYAEAAPRAVIQDILKSGPNLDERRTRADFVRHVAQEIAAFEQAAQKQSAPSMEKVKAPAPPQAATTPPNGTTQRQSVLDAAEEAQRLDAQGGSKRSAAAMAADERLAETIRNLISNEYQGVEDVTRSDKPLRQWTAKERELNSLIDRLETLQSAKNRTRSMTAATAQNIRETTRGRLIDEMRRRIEIDSRIKPTTPREQLTETAREARLNVKQVSAREAIKRARGAQTRIKASNRADKLTKTGRRARASINADKLLIEAIERIMDQDYREMERPLPSDINQRTPQQDNFAKLRGALNNLKSSQTLTRRSWTDDHESLQKKRIKSRSEIEDALKDLETRSLEELQTQIQVNTEDLPPKGQRTAEDAKRFFGEPQRNEAAKRVTYERDGHIVTGPASGRGKGKFRYDLSLPRERFRDEPLLATAQSSNEIGTYDTLDEALTAAINQYEPSDQIIDRMIESAKEERERTAQRMGVATPTPSPAREQLTETVRELTAPSSPLNIDQANAQDTLTETRTRNPESKAADKALIESARELAKTSERGEEIKSAVLDLMNAQQLKRYKRATGDMSARAEDMIEKRREARERLRSATSGEVINNFETMPEVEAQPRSSARERKKARAAKFIKEDVEHKLFQNKALLNEEDQFEGLYQSNNLASLKRSLEPERLAQANKRLWDYGLMLALDGAKDRNPLFKDYLNHVKRGEMSIGPQGAVRADGKTVTGIAPFLMSRLDIKNVKDARANEAEIEQLATEIIRQAVGYAVQTTRDVAAKRKDTLTNAENGGLAIIDHHVRELGERAAQAEELGLTEISAEIESALEQTRQTRQTYAQRAESLYREAKAQYNEGALLDGLLENMNTRYIFSLTPKGRPAKKHTETIIKRALDKALDEVRGDAATAQPTSSTQKSATHLINYRADLYRTIERIA